MSVVNKITGSAISTELNAEMFYKPLKNNDALLSFLETTDYCGNRIRDVLSNGLYQIEKIRKKEAVYSKGCFSNLTEISEGFFGNYFNFYKLYILKGNEEIVIAEKGKVTKDFEFSDLKFTTPQGDFILNFYSD